MVGHVAPEAMDGGPIGLLREGDIITLDIPNRRLDARITEEEMTDRRAAWRPMEPKYTTGVLAKYAKLVSSRIRRSGYPLTSPSLRIQTTH